MHCDWRAGANGLTDFKPRTAEDHHFARLDVAHVGRADQIERARLRADHPRVAQPADRKRTETVRIARRR